MCNFDGAVRTIYNYVQKTLLRAASIFQSRIKNSLCHIESSLLYMRSHPNPFLLIKLTLPCLTMRMVFASSINPWYLISQLFKHLLRQRLGEYDCYLILCVDGFLNVVSHYLFHEMPILNVDVFGAWPIFLTFSQFYGSIVIFEHPAVNLGHTKLHRHLLLTKLCH